MLAIADADYAIQPPPPCYADAYITDFRLPAAMIISRDAAIFSDAAVIMLQRGIFADYFAVADYAMLMPLFFSFRHLMLFIYIAYSMLTDAAFTLLLPLRCLLLLLLPLLLAPR